MKYSLLASISATALVMTLLRLPRIKLNGVALVVLPLA